MWGILDPYLISVGLSIPLAGFLFIYGGFKYVVSICRGTQRSLLHLFMFTSALVYIISILLGDKIILAYITSTFGMRGAPYRWIIILYPYCFWVLCFLLYKYFAREPQAK